MKRQSGGFTLAIKTDGTFVAWGQNDWGQLGLDDTNGRVVLTEVGGSS
jgi:alpha-tubulin suppressor-like RCC1 family protein